MGYFYFVWQDDMSLTGLKCCMSGFNITEAAVFLCRLCFLMAFPFISLKLNLLEDFTFVLRLD